jgi:hypothetical protein
MTAKRFIPTLALCLLALPLALADEDKSDKSSREVVDQFMKATQKSDLGAVLKVVDVPWFHQGDRVIEKRDDLQKEFDLLFKKKNFADLKFELKRLVPYSEVRSKSMPEERQLLDAVLTANDRVALVQVDTEKKGKENIVLLVRLKDGQAKVVGIKD